MWGMDLKIYPQMYITHLSSLQLPIYHCNTMSNKSIEVIYKIIFTKTSKIIFWPIYINLLDSL